MNSRLKDDLTLDCYLQYAEEPTGQWMGENSSPGKSGDCTEEEVRVRKMGEKNSGEEDGDRRFAMLGGVAGQYSVVYIGSRFPLSHPLLTGT